MSSCLRLNGRSTIAYFAQAESRESGGIDLDFDSGPGPAGEKEADRVIRRGTEDVLARWLIGLDAIEVGGQSPPQCLVS